MKYFKHNKPTLKQINLSLDDYAPYDNEHVYNIGDSVSVKEDGKNYKCAKDNTQGKIPKDNPFIWISEPLNALAMFDESNSKATKAKGEIIFSFKASDSIDTFAFFGLKAKNVTISIDEVGGVRKDVSFLAFNSRISNFYEYLYNKSYFIRQKSIKLKAYKDDVITIKVQDFDNISEVKYFTYGQQQSLGVSLYDANVSIKSYSLKKVDEWGNTSLQKRGSYTTYTMPVLINELELTPIVDTLNDLDGQACVFIGDDNSNKHEALTVFGYFENFNAPIIKSSIKYTLKIDSIIT